MGDFNFPKIDWYRVQFGASARCSDLSDNELKFVNSLRENSLLQHVISPTRQRGSDSPHILDLIISFDNFISYITHLSPFGNSDHCILQFKCHMQLEQVRSKSKFQSGKCDYVKLK